MRVLFVKLTSMGDLIHALPAMTDARRVSPNIHFDWVIDKNFSEVASWHPAVKNIFCTSHRQWKKHPWQSIRDGEITNFLGNLRRQKYDLVIDGQTNFKSALITLLSRGKRCGLDKRSAREWIAHLAYRQKYYVPKNLHAITRLRQLFSQIFQYPLIGDQPNYGIESYPFVPPKIALPYPYLVFVHNASWQSKLWSEENWHRLIEMAADEKLHVLLPWGNQLEKIRAQRLGQGHKNAYVLPFCSLSEHAFILKNSLGAVCSDTGLSHLAAALNVPAVTMYGSTSVHLIGTTGANQSHNVSPFPCSHCYKFECKYEGKLQTEPLCLNEIKPEILWQQFQALKHKQI